MNIYLFLTVFIITELFYFISLETLTGYTLGKYIFKIKVINYNFENPTVKQSLIRSLFWVIEANPMLVIVPIITYYIVHNNKTGQRFGDKIAGTYVIRTKYIEKYKDVTLLNSEDFNNKMKEFKEKLPNYYEDLKSSIFFIKYKSKVRIIGIEDLTYDELVAQINNGKEFKIYSYSLIFYIIFTTVSPVYFDQDSSKAISAKIKYIILSLLTSIFYIPTIIYMLSSQLYSSENYILIALFSFFVILSLPALIANLRGGYDVTAEVLDFINKKRFE